jgi:hypothetical protein
MLEEVASWTRGAHEDFTVWKVSNNGEYCCQFARAIGKMRVMIELNQDEATIFNRHMRFPATRADLEELPRRLTIAKLQALIS